MSGIKYSIQFPYLHRTDQLYNTLLSYSVHYADRDDYEIVVWVDGKNTELQLCAFRDIVGKFDLPLRWEMGTGQYQEASYHRNAMAKSTNAEYLILTSPEIVHVSDILSGLDQILDGTPQYVVCACESAKEKIGKLSKINQKFWKHHMWYQHSQHNNRQFHFCTCLKRDDYFRIGGFDTDYAEGVAYDDNDFIDRVRLSDLQIVNADHLLTVHQWHPREKVRRQRKQKLNRNYQLFQKKYNERRNNS